MVHPFSELRFVNATIGYGVFATQFIPRGTITWVFDDLDQVITNDKAASLSKLTHQFLDKYSYRNGRGERILCWDHSRFINHSCRPTSLAPGFDLEIAVRDIEPGEEITDDYASLNLDTEFECACGTPECRKVIGPDDFQFCAPRWDLLVGEAFPLLKSVRQPLWELVRDKEAISDVLAGTLPLPSCRVHLFGENGESSRRAFS